MWIALKDLTILEGAGFAFVTVAGDITWSPSILGKEGPFHASAEPRPAPAAQAGFLDDRNEFFRVGLTDTSGGSLVAAVSFIIFDRGQVVVTLG